MAKVEGHKLYMAQEQLKQRYKNYAGEKRLRAYVESVKNSREVRISFDVKENGTVEFTFDSETGLTEAKKDIQVEVYEVKSVRKPPAYVSPLTIAALEKHDMKNAKGPCELRQFGCPECMRSWWRNVLKSKPVSRCRGRNCGNKRYDALPRDEEFGIGRCLCPNDLCRRQFYAYCEASETLKCRKCRSDCRPNIHPKWRKRARRQLNPNASPFKPVRRRPRSSRDEDIGSMGPQFVPVSQTPHWGNGLEAAFSDLGIQDCQRAERGEGPFRTRRPSGGGASAVSSPPARRRRRRKIFNASVIHTPTGGTISTFLSQIDFEDEQNCTEVDLDYDSDDDQDKVGVCKLECECGNEYMVVMRMRDQAKCHVCRKINNPLRWEPPRDIQKTSDAKHSCSRCNGRENCPNLAAAK